MKVKYVKELLDGMNRNNKDYLFVEYMLAMGQMSYFVGSKDLKRLEKLMKKRGVDYKPKWWEWKRYVNVLKFWWWMKRKSEDYSGLSRTTYSEND